MSATYVDLDGAWGKGPEGAAYVDARAWGARLRYCGLVREVETFWREMSGLGLGEYLLYGSGDFHYLAGVWVRGALGRVAARGVQGEEAGVHVVSFDNHPDWDVRPPRWACGGWVNRVLARPRRVAGEDTGTTVAGVSVWGCGNFELDWPGRVWRNRRALATGRLKVLGWEERIGKSARRMFGGISRGNWREKFGAFARGLKGSRVYVTVDMDCLRAEEAVTNWENGLFEAREVAEAIGMLHAEAEVVGGDLCGAWSRAGYARAGQRLAGWWDHPKVRVDEERAREINAQALAVIWPALRR